MAIVIKTSKPSTLLKAIHKAIDDRKIVTWSYDADGDFTHDTTQWRDEAWLRPVIPDSTSDELRFVMIKPQGASISVRVYAVYHGRFIEMLLAHFDNRFESVIATAMPAYGEKMMDGG